MFNKHLYSNQINAVNYSINNDFQSGVHFHATGTGKSLIALEILLQYNKIYKSNVIWLCEKKNILLDQFNNKTLINKGYINIKNYFTINNFSDKKPHNWYNIVNNSLYWGKPILLIINRAFLVSNNNYNKIKLNFGLIIHDECHSIINKTTQKFYKFALNKYNNLKCIGFSATPNLEVIPYTKVLTKYTIYNAFCDNVILSPKIKWIKCENDLDDISILKICMKLLKGLIYKKIIVWCGIIEQCIKLYNLWKKLTINYKIYLDTSKNDNKDYIEFAKNDDRSILFCACKHREGSDIKNLDCCIFLDKVGNRGKQTFVQCVGRVIRKDKEGLKKYGLIVDLYAPSCIQICDRMNKYLDTKHFPWEYSYTQKIINENKIIINELNLIKKNKMNKLKEYNEVDIINNFIIKCPNKNEYLQRLKLEMKLINEKNLCSYLIRAVEILKLTNYMPHVTRGSCGSSLVCYLLGISNIDPVKYNINFARFLNKYRDNLPDIDFDFSHKLRDEVFLKLELNWPNQVARISNHVHWHEKSALREALRILGIKKRIPKEDLISYIKNLPLKLKNKVLKTKDSLENTFRHYSLHCGGIVFFHDGIPDNLVLKRKTLSQITYDKNEVSKIKQFKIDILSSRGISQLIDINKNINFSEYMYDKKTFNMLQSGNNIGITLAESPLMRKAFIKIKPNKLEDIALCLAIIRPAAKDSNKTEENIDYNNKIIYDDDVIDLLANLFNIDIGLADKFRRCLAKNKWNKKFKNLYLNYFNSLSNDKKKELNEKINNLRMYGFCKSHSFSYAQLVYKLAYEKAHNPKKFWISTLKNSSSSYKKWVHLYEAFKMNVDINKLIYKNKSLYSRKKDDFYKLNYYEQMCKHGYWDMKKYNFYPGCYFYKTNDIYYFNGIIASIRYLKNIIISYIAVSNNKYIEVLLKYKYFKGKKIGIKGRAKLLNISTQTYKAHIIHFF